MQEDGGIKRAPDLSGTIPAATCFCVFCQTGQEKNVVQSIRERFDIPALTPIKIILEKRQGKWFEREVYLMPGYVFAYPNESGAEGELARVPHGYRVLQYAEQMRALYGEDERFALWLLRYNGRLDVSELFSDGEAIQIVEGPLKDCVGTIFKIDKHKRRAQILFDFAGAPKMIWLSFHWISKR